MNDMMNTDGTFSWGWIIFLILILWFFVGGGFGGFGGYGYGNRAGAFLAGEALGSNCGVSNCEVERRALVTAADTNYRIIDQANATRAVVEACKAKNIPIRIGVNSGSLEKDILERDGKPTAKGLVESALRHVKILEELESENINMKVLTGEEGREYLIEQTKKTSI